MLREDQKIEAMDRINRLGMHPNVFKEFTQEDKIHKSETPMAVLYWLNEEEQKLVSAWEKKTGHLVYHAILNNFEGIRELSLLFVSKRKTEWEMENEDLDCGEVFSYVINLEDSHYSEFAYISFKSRFGGLVRIG